MLPGLQVFSSGVGSALCGRWLCYDCVLNNVDRHDDVHAAMTSCKLDIVCSRCHCNPCVDGFGN